jgi:hypothetical protein
MTFQIESGFDLPRPARGRRAVEFPLLDMGVGDSFLIPFDTTEPKLVDSWRRKVGAAKKKVAEAEYRTATMSDGLRVWRTA